MRTATLTWKPKTKDRPRSGRGHTYTPKATRDAEAALAAQWPHPPLDGPVSLTLTFRTGAVHVEVESVDATETRGMTGDLDNYVKLIQDALNGHAYVDDRQIVELHVVKE